MELVRADVERAAPAPGSPVAEVVRGIDAFGLRAEALAAAESGGNTVLSPASIAVAFAMVSAGADEATRRAIATVFGFPDPPGLHEAMNALTTELAATGGSVLGQGDVVLDVSNEVWTQSGMPIEPTFLAALATWYGAGVPTTDFHHDPEGSRAAVNASVAEATRDRITDLMPPGSVDSSTRLVAVNAVYLKAAWSTSFEPDLTAPAPFHLAGGGTVDVPMMRTAPTLSAQAVVAGHYAAVELPYLGGELAMLLVVPTGPATLDDVLAEVAPGGLASVAAGLRRVDVRLTLPRWHNGTALDLTGMMAVLGLPIPGGAFPGIAPDLELQAAVHAADITVDEHGTEAAAATAVAIRATAAWLPGEVVEIVADRPYLFAVRHLGSGAPLFVGRVADPRT
jgi:serine protease inhibitor